MSIAIAVNADAIFQLDLAPARSVIEPLLEKGEIADCEQQLYFEVDFPREPNDPRELSEIPEVRLWFVRLDARYPWLPFLLDWRNGELARYTAMLVPHEFHRTEGIQYNPEALEIFLMKKIFVLADWLRDRELASQSRLKSMSQILGYDLEDALFELIA
jgi:hypothetical protein